MHDKGHDKTIYVQLDIIKACTHSLVSELLGAPTGFQGLTDRMNLVSVESSSTLRKSHGGSVLRSDKG